MVTAVTERVGSIIRFNDAFLDFMLRFNINPVACNVRSPQEKGKIESGIKYIRNNFLPARKFKDLEDINLQALKWLDGSANIRVHNTTGERPIERLCKKSLSPLPPNMPDCRETTTCRVHKDFGVRFDKNIYTVPPTNIGKKVTVKADNRNIAIYYKEKQIATHARVWERYRRLETPQHLEQVRKIKKQRHYSREEEVFLSLGKVAYDYLYKLKETNQRLKKTIEKLLILKDEYGEESLLYAMEEAMKKGLYGGDYIENILYQEMTPEIEHQPVKLENGELNSIRLQATSLKEYDALALKRRRKR